MSEDPQAPDLPYEWEDVTGRVLRVTRDDAHGYVTVSDHMGPWTVYAPTGDEAVRLARAVLAAAGSDARVEEVAPECGRVLPEDAPDGPRVCTLAPEHGGDHRDAEGVSWREMTPREIAAARPQTITLPLHMWSLILDKADRADRLEAAAHSGSEAPALDLEEIRERARLESELHGVPGYDGQSPCTGGMPSTCHCGGDWPCIPHELASVDRRGREIAFAERDEARNEVERLRRERDEWRAEALRDQEERADLITDLRNLRDPDGLQSSMRTSAGARMRDWLARDQARTDPAAETTHDPDAPADPPGPSRCRHCVPGDGVWVHTAPAHRCANADDTGAAGILGRLDRTAHPIARRLEDLIRAVADHEARLAALEDATDLGPDSQGEGR